MAKDKEAVVETPAELAPWEQEPQGAIGVVDAPETVTGVVENTNSAVQIMDEPEVPTSGRQYQETLDFSMKELAIPRLRLASGLTKEVANEEAKSGDWLVSGYPPMKTVDVVIVGVSRFRIYALKEEQQVLCRSDDGVRPVSAVEAQENAGNPTGMCATCPMAQWGPDGTGRGGKGGRPPACAEGFSYQAFVLTHGVPVILDLKKTQLTAAQKINSQLYMRGPRSAVITLGSEMVNSPVGGGKYPLPTIQIRPIRPEELAEVESFFPRSA